MAKVILKIDGMSCSACQNRVEKYLNKQDGVEASVYFSFNSRSFS